MSFNFNIPCCEPLQNYPGVGQFNERSRQCFTHAELEKIPQCQPRCPSPRPRCITIQQPPRLICRKRVVFISKIISDPMAVNRCKIVVIPKVIEITKVIKVPKLSWIPQLIKESKVIYYKANVPDPYLVCVPRTIKEPRTLCQMMMCQPKPQIINIPQTIEYCCYPIGPTRYKPSVSCSTGPVPGGVPYPKGECHPFGPMQCYPNRYFSPYPQCGSSGKSLALCRLPPSQPIIYNSLPQLKPSYCNIDPYMRLSIFDSMNTGYNIARPSTYYVNQFSNSIGPFVPPNAFSMCVPQRCHYYQLNNNQTIC